ncbi:MAG: B12-binding domain-containing radical SAM protein, partial [Dehalococcoidia bacterium]
ALPLVVAGGRCALNPEPMADFIDAYVLGDGEEPMLAVTEVVRRFKAAGGSRDDLLAALARLPGVYVPSLYQVRYHGDGTVAAVEPQGGAPARARRQRASRLPQGPLRPVVPYAQIMHDRAVLEVQRGIEVGCRCCQLGAEGRPALARGAGETAALARELIANTGYNELFLVAPTPVDGPTLLPTLQALKGQFGDWVTIATPSLSVEGFGGELAQALVSRGRNSIAFTPEAGSQRLRQVINRPASDDEVLAVVETAFRYGFVSVRLHFKVGLPTETLDDVRATGELAAQARALGRRYHGNRARVRLGVTPFVPRPHTPFQWACQETTEELAAKHELLKRACRRAGVELSWEEESRSLLEAALARGDRRLGAVVRRAWELGGRLDAWRELYQWSRWEQAFTDASLSPGFYAQREPAPMEVLPWSHIDAGVDDGFLRAQWQKGLRGEVDKSSASW